MSDNIKQESTESLQTKEQEQQAGSNKRTLEAENDKASFLCGDRRTRFALYSVKALWGKRGSSRGNYDAGADRGSAADD